MADITNNLPPANIEAEEAILGGILLDPEAMTRVAELLVKDAFYVKAHQEIYHAALTLNSKAQPTDLMAVSTYLSDRDLLEKIGGTTKLAQLLNRTVSAVNIDRYAKLIMQKYIRRLLITSGHEIVDLGYDNTTELEVVLDASEQKIFRLTQERPQEGLIPISETLINTFNTIEDLHQDTALPGIPSGYYDLDAMTSGFSRSDLIIIAGRPSMGKCLEANSELVCADGSIATIESIYHRRNTIGNFGDRILTLQDNWKFTQIQPSAFVDDGIKPVFRVTTGLGRCIETTLTHPYLTIQGWQKLSELKSGDKIAVPRQINIFGTKTIAAEKVKLLAYLIGDACLTKTCPEFTNSNSLLRDEFIQCITSFSELNYSDYLAQNSPNSLTIWLKELSLWKKNACQKNIPDLIFTLERSLVALFLNRLFATNGWVTVIENEQAQISYCTVSEKLARQIQHLLLRFKVVASVKLRSLKDKNGRNKAWQITIIDAESIKNFSNEIGMFGKEDQVDAAKKALSTRMNKTNYDLIPLEACQELKVAKDQESWATLAEQVGIKDYNTILVEQRTLSREKLFELAFPLDNISFQNLATSEIYWDEIVSIEAVGNKQVYDLTIPETHNFVANDICVHNTAFALCVASNIAKDSKLPIAIFSLEMSREQLTQRLLSSEARIASNRLRSGRIAQNEFDPLVNAVGRLSKLPIYIDDTANLTVMQMRSQVRRLQAQQKDPLGLVLLDYLQLMEGGDNDNRVQQLSKMTRSLKGLARELNVPIVALSQLSRGVEQRTNKRPMLSDLRESGSIEQDADLVMMIYRDEYYNPDTPDRGITEVSIVKHRNGPVGTIKLLFNAELTKFESLAKPSGY
jgi:replicative DNA helicase